MRQGQFEKSNSWFKAGQWLVVVVLLTFIVLMGWTVLTKYIQGGNHLQITIQLKWFQFFQTVATFLLPPFIVAWLWSNKPLTWLQLDNIPQMKIGKKWSSSPFFIMATVVMIVALPGINLLADWNSQMILPEFLKHLEEVIRQQEEAAAVLTERFLRTRGMGSLLTNMGLMALLPALAEELTFRGVLQRLIAGKSTSIGTKITKRQHLAVWIVAIIFSAIHFQFYGFVPRMLLGALFGYAFCFTGSLWIPIVMHFTNNGATVFAYWYIYQQNFDTDVIENFGIGETAWIGVASIVLACIGSYAMWRLSRIISNASSRIS